MHWLCTDDAHLHGGAGSAPLVKIKHVLHTFASLNKFKRFSPRAVVLDCREANEFNVSCIPGAFNVPFTQFKMAQAGKQTQCELATDVKGEKHTHLLVNILDLEMKKHLGRELKADDEVDVVCYCSVGYRSSVIAERILELREEGHLSPGVQPYNLRGSIFQWASEGRNLTRAELSDGKGGCVETQVKTVHPFSRLWGSLALPFSLWQWEWIQTHGISPYCVQWHNMEHDTLKQSVKQNLVQHCAIVKTATSPASRFSTKTQHGTMHSTIGRWEDHRLPFRPWKCHICHDSFMIWWYDFVSLIQRHALFVSSLDPSSGKVPTRKWSSDLQPAVPLVRKMHRKGKVKHVFLVNFVQF